MKALLRQAMEALEEVIPPHLRSNRHGEGFMGQRYETIRSALSSALEAGEEPETANFDEWMENPYTKVLMRMIGNDYVPRADAASPVPADTQGDAKLLVYLESQKFHPSASHVPPDYRDGYNHALQTVIERIHSNHRAAISATPEAGKK